VTGGLRVLLVEDSPDDAELIELELCRNGFQPEIVRVETADEMSAALVRPGWDVVLSDFHLPTFSAEQALDALRASGLDLPFIILSGAVQAEDAVILLKRGAHDFLNKDSLARLGPAIERELREAQERSHRRIAEERVSILSRAVEQSPVSVVITDPAGIIEYVNPKFTDATGYGADEAIGRELLFARLQDMGHDSWASLWHTVGDGMEWRGEFCSRRRDGRVIWEYVTVSPLKDETETVRHYIAVKEDITARRSYEEQLLRQATFDDLTGLPNRVLVLDRLEQALALAHRESEQTAVLYIDLDRFKTVNETQGHNAGDHLLVEAAARLSACLREGDTLARMGGDEFLLILPGLEDGEEARLVADRVLEIFLQPFAIDGQEHFISASIGVTLFPGDGLDPQVLLRNADLAMYRAKEQGGNGHHFFTPEINQRMRQRLAIEKDLRGAMIRQEMEAHFQPVVDLSTYQPVAVEALMRWRRPEQGLVMPGLFIPVAEEMGLIRPLGEWVLTRSCRDVMQSFSAHPDLRLAVNVSPRQLQVPGFGLFVRQVLESTGLAPERLELEITESVLMDEALETAENLKSLCDLGVRLSIDDFGTGYSSLGYLQRYPFDTLKIDRSFVMSALDNQASGRLVETIITMAHGLRMEVIAEGVETPEQLAFLKERDCDLVQGYLFSKPLPPSELKGQLLQGYSRQQELLPAQ
jgi:diguanylate cyclase (GGDEF)-like protein/PAS domain S-box-containing protein